MDEQIRIDQFLDGEGRITKLPRKQKARIAVLGYLAGKFEPGRDYTEKQVNAICGEWHTFDDFFILRRELVDYKLLSRERNGSRYWRTPEESAGSPGELSACQKSLPLTRKVAFAKQMTEGEKSCSQC